MSQTGKLSTHVLDTMHGTPAAGLSITLYVWDGPHASDRLDGGWRLIKQAQTNADGRTGSSMLKLPMIKTPILFRVSANLHGRAQDPSTGTAPSSGTAGA